jgi:ABC-type Mn/Zn transport systems, ATPase component
MLSCKDVSISYDGKTVVKDVGFEINKGDYLCIIGENGSGKTTLMKGILNLVKLSSGKVSFDGISSTEIGYLPQQTLIQKNFPASVYEIVLSGCLARGKRLPFYTKKDKETAANNIDKLSISDIKNSPYKDLSGGQQQRVLLARALCATEKLIMLDEPVTGLDPLMASEMYSLLTKLNDNHNGTTIIMISHDIKSAVQYGNKILHMHTSPLFFGNTEDYIKTDIYRRMIGGVENV